MDTKTYLYTIYDMVAEQSGPLFEAVNDKIAIRAVRKTQQFTDAAMEGEFKLLCVGEVTREPLTIKPTETIYEIIVNNKENKDGK